MDKYDIGTFSEALALNKAMSHGARTAINFTKELADWKLLNPYYAGRPMHLARHLNHLLYRPFEFRPLDEKEQRDELNFESIEQITPGIAGYSAHDKAVREEIKSYDSRPVNPESKDIIEPQTGHYTQKDYEWMNKAFRHPNDAYGRDDD